MAAKTGAATRVIKLKLKHPELTHGEIAKTVGCTRANVSGVLATFLAGTSDETLRDFQERKADVFDSLQYRLLSSLTPSKIAKAKPMEIITGAAILEDKARLVRGQATGINVNVLLDVVDAMRARPAQHPQPIGDGSASNGDPAAP
jgi:hypothetical protein